MEVLRNMSGYAVSKAITYGRSKHLFFKCESRPLTDKVVDSFEKKGEVSLNLDFSKNQRATKIYAWKAVDDYTRNAEFLSYK
jgi:hypothetical protein